MNYAANAIETHKPDILRERRSMRRTSPTLALDLQNIQVCAGAQRADFSSCNMQRLTPARNYRPACNESGTDPIS